MFVVHHIADSDFSRISKSRLGIDLAVVRLVEVGAKRVVQGCLQFVQSKVQPIIPRHQPSIGGLLLAWVVLGAGLLGWDCSGELFPLKNIVPEIDFVWRKRAVPLRQLGGVWQVVGHGHWDFRFLRVKRGQVGHGHGNPVVNAGARQHEPRSVPAQEGRDGSLWHRGGASQLREVAVPDNGVDGHNGAVPPPKPEAVLDVALLALHHEELLVVQGMGVPFIHIRGVRPPRQFDGVVCQIPHVKVQVGGKRVVQKVFSEGVIGPVRGEHELRRSRPKSGLQIVKSVPPQRAVVVGQDVVTVEVALAILQGRHQENPTVRGIRHVQDLVDFEDFAQVHILCGHVDKAQTWSAFKFQGECEGSALGVPSEAWGKVVVQPVETVAQHHVPCPLPRAKVKGAYAPLPALVRGEGHLCAIRRREELLAVQSWVGAHGNVFAKHSPRLSQFFGPDKRGKTVRIGRASLSQMVPLCFHREVREHEACGQPEAIFDTPRDPGHVQDVGHCRDPIDVRHIGPHCLPQKGRIRPAGLVDALECARLASIEDPPLAFRIQPSGGIPREPFRHPFGHLHQIATPQCIAPLGFVHGLVEENPGQTFANILQQTLPVACGVDKHFAPHQTGRSSNVGGFILGQHDADIALSELFLRIEHQDLNGAFHGASKKRSEVLGLGVQHPGNLSSSLVSSAVVVDFEHALFEILPFEPTVLHAVFAILHIESIGELPQGIGDCHEKDP